MQALSMNRKNARDMEHMTLKQLPVGIQTYSAGQVTGKCPDKYGAVRVHH